MTAPESSPKPAAAAIARKIVAELYPELLTGLSDDLVEFTLKVKAIIPFVEQAAAIQRGDGQTKSDLALAEEYANAIIRHSESYGSVAKGFALACFDEVIRKAQLLSTPPAAKPNETSGATPELEQLRKENTFLRVRVQKLGCPYNNTHENGACKSGYPGCACADDLMAIQCLSPEDEEKAAIRLGKRVEELERELNAVRKSSGAAGAEAPVEFVEVGLDGRKIPHTTDAKVWASEFVKTITANPSIASDVDTMIGWFANAMCAQLDESDRRHAAKSTPGVESSLQKMRDDDAMLIARDIRGYQSDSAKIAYVHGWNDALCQLELTLRAVKQEQTGGATPTSSASSPSS